jgi:hypothetical protein
MISSQKPSGINWQGLLETEIGAVGKTQISSEVEARAQKDEMWRKIRKENLASQLDAAIEMQKLATDETIKKLKKTDIAKIKKEIEAQKIVIYQLEMSLRSPNEIDFPFAALLALMCEHLPRISGSTLGVGLILLV